MNRCFIALTAMFTTLAALTPAAQDTPDIVWSTNAHRSVVGALAFSKDGAFLASGAFGTGHVWSVSNRSLVRSFSILDAEGSSGVTSLAFSPDNSLFAMGDGMNRFRIWRLPSATLVFASSEGTSDRSIDALCFSPDGTLFAWAGAGPWVNLNMTPEGTSSGLFRLPNFSYPEEGPSSRDVRFSQDGKWLAVGFSDHTARIYRMAEGYEQRNLAGHSGEVTSVDFSPDGRMLATTAADGDARLWSIPEGQLIRTIRGGGGTTVDLYRSCGRFSADGKSLLTLSNEIVRFWNVADGRLLLTYPDLQAFSMAVSPDGKHFAFGAGSLISTTGTVVLARMPVFIDNPKAQTNHLNFDWQGGSGLYQVQQNTSVTSAVWANLGPPTAATSLTMPMTNAATFFRVQSLTNAP